MNTAILTLALLVPATARPSVDDPREILTETQATEHFEIRYRARSRAGAAVDRVAHEIELEYAEILEELGIAGKVDESQPFYVFLYDSVAELSSITKAEGAGGFSAGRETHIPWDNDQTRKHELVHIVVAAMKSTGDEPRNMFFCEGIANAVLEYVHGVPVHAVAAYERKRGSLPALETLVEHESFYDFLRENPGLNGYDVAGSFFLYLLETYPPKRVMTYYHGRPIEKALGKSLARVEKGWHERLDEIPMRPALEILLSRRRGDGGEFSHLLSAEERLGAELLGSPEEWRVVQGELAATDEIGTWRLEAEAAEASNSSGSDWSIVEVPGKRYGDCVLRVKARIGDSCWGIKLRYGSDCRAMVLGNGTFLYTEEGACAFAGECRLRAGTEIDLILAVEDDHARVFVDGDLVLEADRALEPSPIGLGIVGGSATFTGFSVRER